MSVIVDDVEAIPPHIFFADEGLGEFGAGLMSEMVSGSVVGEDVGVRRSKKRRSFEESNLVGGNKFL